MRVNDKMSGHGTYWWADGSQYQGTWENDKKSGYGTRWYMDGGRYEGMWENDKRHGDGVYRYCQSDSRDVFIGKWNDDVAVGEGILKKKDGSSDPHYIFGM